MKAIGVIFLAALLLQAASYDAVSIKPSSPDSEGSSSKSDNGYLVMRNVTLKRCIRIAYGTSDDLIFGGPKWLDEKHYDIEARTAHPVGSGEAPLMIQTMLADRFHLTLHHETRSYSRYALTATKNGLKAKAAPADTPPSKLNTTNGGRGRMDASALSMAGLARRLSSLLGAPVEDDTNLPGYFDFTLKWNPEDPQADTPDGPSLFAALQEQLGLKLEARKLPTDVLVIDRAELPSEN